MNAHNTTQQRSGSRLPNPQQLVPALGEVGAALFKATGNGAIPPTTISLVQLRAGQIVGSAYLAILHAGNLRTAGESEDRIAAVATWRDAPHFTEPERAALALVEAVVLQPASHGERVPEELYAQVAEHYDDTALATLAMVIGQVNFFVPLALIGKPLPGRPPAEQWTPVMA
ncbi:carboxymuconolactone decarboxylase family protein [Nocardia abscessus]|uniref:carboxymuconolactone decarboxylase family protein n=1 Tax=Nocardia abscessus TaxID=120957 RepID=UPI0002E5665B|nr:carboxymuconolactone decarboxylase family protein [Nocardia abscessus]MCC3330273.1 carboxymuconolactone decarboxylase family protein [Nocardia abscessus]